MLDHYWSGGYEPVIDSRFPLSELGNAQIRPESADAAGKVIVQPCPIWSSSHDIIPLKPSRSSMTAADAPPASLPTHIARPVRVIAPNHAFYRPYTTITLIHHRTTDDTHSPPD